MVKCSISRRCLDQVRNLIQYEHIPVQEIMVLTPYSARSSRLKEARLDDFKLEWSTTSQNVRVETIHSFKGLERSVIILVEVERWLTQGVKSVDIEKLLYVGCSRACNHLLVLLPRNAWATIQQWFRL